MRRRTGLPHKILLDEAHYFLADADHTRMIDPELAGYIVVTYHVSALDLRHERAGEVLRRLVRDTDVLIESARPGSMEQRGIGYSALAEVNPRLVWCSITGFGRGSPYADRPAHDVTFLGYAGLLSMMVGDTVPAAPQFVIAVPIGALMATVGILVALRNRERRGSVRSRSYSRWTRRVPGSAARTGFDLNPNRLQRRVRCRRRDRRTIRARQRRLTPPDSR
jgi:hypothetical protein